MKILLFFFILFMLFTSILDSLPGWLSFAP